MGYGEKGYYISFAAKQSHSPSPERYDLPSSFVKTKAFSFGLSKEHFQRVYLKENPPHDRSVPGPGAYYNN
eukprot:CAMPEP_0202971670 /NCGR_PEP_ID=MMETSP1396-20130829/29436_1 /ASSEMBLY_ACC=CAM_ASM_000872 /TAXON_ID= /ORGANISM="Pseudokeronopsis sp., Strain Brazil" /LENGTH=70 /DNA_ID=CAMNT_0049701287 /DNA_START=127 /DNA_END=339 /DNA_ORIENTATION=-